MRCANKFPVPLGRPPLNSARRRFVRSGHSIVVITRIWVVDARWRCRSPQFRLGSIGPMMVITMSRTEIDRMSVLQDLAASRIKVTEAATLMSLGRRQVFRLAKAYAQRGPEALVSRRRGGRAI